MPLSRLCHEPEAMNAVRILGIFMNDYVTVEWRLENGIVQTVVDNVLDGIR